MSECARDLTLTWATLLTLAVASVWLVDHRVGSALTVTMVMVVAAAKACLVLNCFMELRQAPKIIQLCLYTWAGGCVLLVIGLR